MSLIQNLAIRVSSVQFTEYEEEQVVHVRFSGSDHLNQVNLNGYIVATQEEYFQNASMEKLHALVKEKLVQRIEMTDAGSGSETGTD